MSNISTNLSKLIIRYFNFLKLLKSLIQKHKIIEIFRVHHEHNRIRVPFLFVINRFNRIFGFSSIRINVSCMRVDWYWMACLWPILWSPVHDVNTWVTVVGLHCWTCINFTFLSKLFMVFGFFSSMDFLLLGFPFQLLILFFN